MKSRTCLYCGYKYSRIEYVKKLLFKHIWSNWECPKCKQEITFDDKRRFLVALLFGIWIFILRMATQYFNMDLILWLLFGVLFLVGSIFIFTFDRFKKTNKS